MEMLTKCKQTTIVSDNPTLILLEICLRTKPYILGWNLLKDKNIYTRWKHCSTWQSYNCTTSILNLRFKTLMRTHIPTQSKRL